MRSKFLLGAAFTLLLSATTLIACKDRTATKVESSTEITPKVIAHRGFWQKEGSAQNSIAALRFAADAKLYGSEFDVLITNDGVLVVNHDDDIEGIVIEEASYDQIKDIKISNGERLPTLEEYLIEGKKHPHLQLILELKPHKKKENEDLAVAKIVEMVREMGIEKQVEYISFSMNVCEGFINASPSSEVAYLSNDVDPEGLKERSFTGIDANYNVYFDNSDWIERSHKLGLKVNVWTVNSDEHLQRLIDGGVDFVTTDRPLESLAIIKNAK